MLIRELGSYAAKSRHIPLAAPGTALVNEVASACAAAVARVRRRLSGCLSESALDAADQYFEKPGVCEWGDTARPEIGPDELFATICGSPRSATVTGKAAGLQIELRSLDEEFELEALGDQIEPGSDVLMLSPQRLAAAAARNTSIELRQFDRQCISWAAFADDVGAVTAADVYLKLFLADGNRSVNGWHRDASDVLVTTIAGAKRFAVADVPPGAPEDSPVPVVDTVLRPGDALRLPRSMLHCATPQEGLSALLSMGLMRAADWPYRQTPPVHLGFPDYPRSTAVYRLCLRSHVPPTRGDLVDDPQALLRTRIPGGLAVSQSHGSDSTFVAAGTLFEANNAVLRTLAIVHGSDGISVENLATATDASLKQCRETARLLVRHGLVRT